MSFRQKFKLFILRWEAELLFDKCRQTGGEYSPYIADYIFKRNQIDAVLNGD